LPSIRFLVPSPPTGYAFGRAVTQQAPDSRALRGRRASFAPPWSHPNERAHHDEHRHHLRKVQTIINGDCLDILRSFSKERDFILTDPPYIAHYKSRTGARSQRRQRRMAQPLSRNVPRLQRDTFCVSFYGWPHADKFMQATARGFRRRALRIPKRYTSAASSSATAECAYLLRRLPKAPDNTSRRDRLDVQRNKLHLRKSPLRASAMVDTFAPRARGARSVHRSGSSYSPQRCLAVRIRHRA